MEHVTFVGVFFLLVLLTVVLYYAFLVIPPVRTLGREKQPVQMVEYNYTTQFAPLLGYRIRPVDFTTPENSVFNANHSPFGLRPEDSNPTFASAQVVLKPLPEKKLFDASGNLL